MMELDICKEPADRFTVDLARERGSGLGGERRIPVVGRVLEFRAGSTCLCESQSIRPCLVSRILDRFLAHATIVQMAGKSYRLRPRATAEPT
jgi:hypothetical protein